MRFQFSTHNAAGANVAPSSAFEAADLRIYKATDGAAFSATQRSSANGITMTSPFDSLTGYHDVDIDLTDNTDSGFYAAGSLYAVVLAPDETVDSQALTGVVLAYFEIGVQPVNVTHFGGSAGTFASGRPETNINSIANNAITAAAIATGAIDADAIADNAIDAGALAADAITSAKLADGAITAAKIAADAIGASELAADAVAEIADAVWDEAASGHVASGSFGQRLGIIRAGTAQAGASTTITLDGSASSTDDFYNNTIIVITGGTGAGQSRIISDYVGSTKVASVSAWVTNPSSDSVFVILPFGAIPGATAPTAAEVADAVWDEATSGHTTGGTFGEQVKTDIDAILEDTGTTLQAELDGIQADTEDIQTRLPAALVSGRMASDAVAISGSTTAADNVEANIGNLDDAITDVMSRLGAPTGASVSADIADVEGKVDDLESRLGTPSNLGSGATVAANLVDIESQTDDIGTAGAGLTAVPWNAAWDAEIESEVADALEATIADSIPADGTRPSVKQALYMLTQFMTERSVSSTTVTVKKADGSTSLFTLTLNDATTPTGITRAT